MHDFCVARQDIRYSVDVETTYGIQITTFKSLRHITVHALPLHPHTAVIFRFNLFSFVYLIFLLTFDLIPGPRLKSQKGTMRYTLSDRVADYNLVCGCNGTTKVHVSITQMRCWPGVYIGFGKKSVCTSTRWL